MINWYLLLYRWLLCVAIMYLYSWMRHYRHSLVAEMWSINKVFKIILRISWNNNKEKYEKCFRQKWMRFRQGSYIPRWYTHSLLIFQGICIKYNVIHLRLWNFNIILHCFTQNVKCFKVQLFILLYNSCEY